METKLSKVKALFVLGKTKDAMRIVKSFPRLGNESDCIRTAWDAMQNPGLYRQMKLDPDKLWEDGITAVCKKFNISVP